MGGKILHRDENHENNIENNGGAPEAPKKKQIVHVFRLREYM